MRKSCIVQRKNSRLIVLHEDYIEICDGNMIAAMLLSILIYWTDVKLAQREQEQEQRNATGEDIPLTQLWIWKSQEGFQHDLLDDKPGMRKVHRSTIATALKLLKEKKFVMSRRNPHNNIDRTQQYLINQDAINTAIQALPDCTISDIREMEIVQSNVGKDAMDCTISDDGLHKNRQTIPEITERDYIPEITQRERGVANATARAFPSSSENDEDTERRAAVRTNTNTVHEPPAPTKPKLNVVKPVIPPKRPKQAPITMPISDEAQRILDDWRSLFARKIPIIQTDITASELFVKDAIDPTREELRLCRAWHFSTDDPKRPWYGGEHGKGVNLMDAYKNWGKWQSTLEAPPDKAARPPGNEESEQAFQGMSQVEVEKLAESIGHEFPGLKMALGTLPGGRATLGLWLGGDNWFDLWSVDDWYHPSGAAQIKLDFAMKAYRQENAAAAKVGI